MVSLPNARMVSAHKGLWQGRANVYSTDSKTDPSTGITTGERKELYVNVPCHLSFKRIEATDGANLAKQALSAVLFCAQNLVIPPGSRFVVSQRGVNYILKQSGRAAVYAAHQEIPLELEATYA